MKYTMQQKRRHWPRRIVVVAIIGILGTVLATAAVRYVYSENLKPVSSSQAIKLITVKQGMTVDEIAAELQKQGLIRSAWAFKLYVSSKEVRNALQAGTYEVEPNRSVPEIVAQLTHGKIATNLVTILPGHRLDQVKKRLMQDGFKENEVTAALDPEQYKDHPALVDKPASATLEGYLYPESYQRVDETSAKSIVQSALTQMQDHLTPELRGSFSKQGLSTYQAITLASIVEKEVPHDKDRQQVAQVFLKRYKIGMKLQSDATASYGAVLDGKKPTNSYDSAYNTYVHEGLPPTPISNVSASSLKAVANPADTDWLYFVSGDDGVTHFSKTLEEHESLTSQYCKKLCTQP